MKLATARKLLDIYKQHLPDLVLLDVNMPVKEGLEALKEIIEFAYR